MRTSGRINQWESGFLSFLLLSSGSPSELRKYLNVSQIQQKITYTSYPITNTLVHIHLYIITLLPKTTRGIQVRANLPRILTAKHHTIPSHKKKKERERHHHGAVLPACVTLHQTYRYTRLTLTISVSCLHETQPLYPLNSFSSWLGSEVPPLKKQQPHHLPFFYLHFLLAPPSCVEENMHPRVRDRTGFHDFTHT